MCTFEGHGKLGIVKHLKAVQLCQQSLRDPTDMHIIKEYLKESTPESRLDEKKAKPNMEITTTNGRKLRINMVLLTELIQYLLLTPSRPRMSQRLSQKTTA